MIGIKEFYRYKEKKDYLKISSVNEHLSSCDDIKECELYRLNYSEMYVPAVIPFDTNCDKLSVDVTKHQLVYIGRLQQNGGIVLPFLKKLMKVLGNSFQLFIIPGSFQIPSNDKMVKYNAKRPNHFKLLKKYIDDPVNKFDERFQLAEDEDMIGGENIGKQNIILLEPINWGEQYDLLKQCQIGLNFSPNRVDGYECQVANTKLFDYLASGLKVVSEAGCQNNYMIKKYNAGIVIDHIGTISEYARSIKELANDDNFNQERLSENFISNENYHCRAVDISDKCIKYVESVNKNDSNN